MYNRWLHICQAIDFKTSKITSVVNGFVSDVIVYESFSGVYNGSNPLGRIETLKDHFIIGLVGEGGEWKGK